MNQQTCKKKTSCVSDSVLLLPTEHNKLTLTWRDPYKVVREIGDEAHRVEIETEKVKNVPHKYFEAIFPPP